MRFPLFPDRSEDFSCALIGFPVAFGHIEQCICERSENVSHFINGCGEFCGGLELGMAVPFERGE
jgi:hypothetical protein